MGDLSLSFPLADASLLSQISAYVLFFAMFSFLKRKQYMKTRTTSRPNDIFRQVIILIATPLIWVFSSLGVFLEGARSPSEFSDLTVNWLVPETIAFSIWGPIFIGIIAYGIIQALPANRARQVYRDSGWWIAAGLWGVASWGLVTAYIPDNNVEVLASLVFAPTMIFLVIGMIKLWRGRGTLTTAEKWLVLAPISLIAGWCSIAIFVGLNGLVWKFVEPLGWNITATALSVLGLALWWGIYILRHGALNKIYAFPIVWGLGFLALRQSSEGGDVYIGVTAIIGIAAILLAASLRGKTSSKIW